MMNNRHFKVLLLSLSLILVPACSKHKSNVQEGSYRGKDSGRNRVEEDDSAPLDVMSSSKIDRSEELRDPNALPDTVYFDFDKSTLHKDDKEVIRRHVANLKKVGKPSQNIRVMIDGHCDERGTAAYNMALGHRRSSAVHKEMKRLGLHSSVSVEVRTFGKSKPKSMGHTEYDHSLNRRAEIIYSNKKAK